MVADDFQPRPGGFHYSGIDPVGQQAKQALHAAHTSQDFLPGGREFVRPDLRLAKIPYRIQAAFQNDTGDENSGFGHALMLSYEHAFCRVFPDIQPP